MSTTAFVLLAFAITAFLLTLVYIFGRIATKREREYIKMEIGRSLSEEEYLYWKHELKNLNIRIIPIYGALRNKKINNEE